MKNIVTGILLIVISFSSCNKKTIDESQAPVAAIDGGKYATEDLLADVTIDSITNSTFNFALTVVTADAHCTGEQSGKAILEPSTGKWIYEDKVISCKLTFEFSENTVNVMEDGTCDHGASCWYSGKYMKEGTFTPVKPVIDEEEGGFTSLMDYYLDVPEEYLVCESAAPFDSDERKSFIQIQKENFIQAKFPDLDKIQMALFYSDNKTYCAFIYECGAGCMCTKRAFFTHDSKGWADHYADMFPDLSSLEENDTPIGLRLPETVIAVYNFDTGETLAELSWNGSGFDLKKL